MNRRSLFAGAALAVPANVFAAVQAPSSAATAWAEHQALWAYLNEAKNLTDEEYDDLWDSRNSTLEDAIWRSPCNSPGAAVAKLEFSVQALAQGGSAYDADLIAQVLAWIKRL